MRSGLRAPAPGLLVKVLTNLETRRNEEIGRSLGEGIVAIHRSTAQSTVVSMGRRDLTDVGGGGMGGGTISARTERKAMVVEKGNEQVGGNEMLEHLVGENKLATDGMMLRQ